MKPRKDFKHSLDWAYYLEKELPKLETQIKQLQKENDELKTLLGLNGSDFNRDVD